LLLLIQLLREYIVYNLSNIYVNDRTDWILILYLRLMDYLVGRITFQEISTMTLHFRVVRVNLLYKQSNFWTFCMFIICKQIVSYDVVSFSVLLNNILLKRNY